MTPHASPYSRSIASARVLLSALLLAAAAVLAACGTGSGLGAGMSSSTGASSSMTGTSGMQSCNSGCGSTRIMLADAAGDFDRYLVYIDSLTLTRADGTVVETISTPTQVDFTELVNLSEILSAAQVPDGRYVTVQMTLDFNNASIVVDNGMTGVPITQGNIIDGQTGNPLVSPNSQMLVTLSLPANSPLVITQGTVANLALDFDLTASNTIAPSASSPMTVTVNPVLTASLVPDTTRQLHVRGPLVSVDANMSSYVIDVRPFFDASGMNGQLTVNTTPTTTYSINGTSYTGAAGLTQLATLSAGTLTAAYGTWDTTNQTFTASSVLAGSSVAGVRLDSVEGTVVARSGDSLTLQDGLIWPAGPIIVGFQRTVTVTVGPSTMVSENGVAGSFTISDISIGQHAQFLGTLSSASASSSSSSSSSSASSNAAGNGAMSAVGQASFWGSQTLDATSGSALLSPTPAVGTVASAAAGTVTLNLQSLDGLPPSSFNFAGTGSTTDASASAYSVAVSPDLSTSSLTMGMPASFIGFVAPFGTAPPDFNASTLISYAATNAELYVRWPSPGVTAPFATLTSTGLSVSQATLQASAVDVIRVASVSLNPATLAAGLQIDPDAAAMSVRYAIVHLQSRMINTYSTFGDLVTALTTELNGTNAAVQVDAQGPYDASTGVFQAAALIVAVND